MSLNKPVFSVFHSTVIIFLLIILIILSFFNLINYTQTNWNECTSTINDNIENKNNNNINENTRNKNQIQQLILNDQNKISIAFLHMHKAGGTTFCKNIRHTFPISSYQKLHNCNFKNDGPHNSQVTSKDKTCDQRINEVEKNRIKMFSIERFLDNVICDQFFYITILRDPLTRLVSHHAYEGKELNKKPRRIKRALKDDVRNIEPYYVTRWSYSTINNYYIRTLLGYDYYFNSDLTEINEEVYNLALTRLKQLDLVLILEHLDDIKNLLQELLGWNFKLHHKSEERHTTFNEYFSKNDQQLLKEHNQWDIKLYNYAKDHIESNQIAHYNKLIKDNNLNDNKSSNSNNNNNNNNQLITTSTPNNGKSIHDIILNDQNKISIAFLHMHKTGGTTFCQNIRHTFRINSYQKLHNCNFKNDGPHNSQVTSKDKTCDQRINEVEKIELKCLVLKDF